MVANVGKIVLALGLFSFFLNENVHADAWSSDHDDHTAIHSYPAYVRISYSPEDEKSENQMQDPKMSYTPNYYVINEAGKVRVFRTKAPHRSGRLFVNPLHPTDASAHTDSNEDSIFQVDESQKENNSEISEEDRFSLETIGYTTELLRQEGPYSLVSYIQ
ncbi:MAG: hypothetical protein EBT45_02860 [Alphaproteobacteria bacterium]|nr:hypothetical protein [Alphaproteobacteria bacterium]